MFESEDRLFFNRRIGLEDWLQAYLGLIRYPRREALERDQRALPRSV